MLLVPTLDHARLRARLAELAALTGGVHGPRARRTLEDGDLQARQRVAGWMREAGAEVTLDQIGNLHAILPGRQPGAPVTIGSHLDTVMHTEAYDGGYGVLAGIEVLAAVSRQALRPERALAVTVFTNRAGERFTPDRLGARVMTKQLALRDALDTTDTNGMALRQALQRSQQAGTASPWHFLPQAYLELHVEQGPGLAAAGIDIGVVEGVQGCDWWEVSITGRTHHAGSTPMALRQDAGAAAMDVARRLTERSLRDGLPSGATVGTFELDAAAIHRVPGRARFTADLRDLDSGRLRAAVQALRDDLAELQTRGFVTHLRRLTREPAVRFDGGLCRLIGTEARRLGLAHRTVSTGVPHDAQILATLCPSAMILVPGRNGSTVPSPLHAPASLVPALPAAPHHLAAGAELLCGAVLQLAQVPVAIAA